LAFHPYCQPSQRMRIIVTDWQRYISAPNPDLSIDTSQCHASATWMEFPQTSTRRSVVARQLANPTISIGVSNRQVFCIPAQNVEIQESS